MSKPDWCPQDLWEKARSAAAWATPLYADGVSKSEKREVVEAFAAALLSERERCAKVADYFHDTAYSEGMTEDVVMARAYTASDIAAAIRKGD